MKGNINMTECERIINSGILQKTFFEAETRDGFFVSEKRKKIWAIQIDMLLEFDRICKKHNLKYYLQGGTLLGAVRHRGFIPWDDDLDVEMWREDYDKFVQLKDEFKSPYFLQTTETDPECFYSFAKIRNSNTTGISSEVLAYQEMNHGIWIDIYPLDSWKREDREGYEKIRELNKSNGTYMRIKNPNLDEADKIRVRNWEKTDPHITSKEIQNIARKYQHEETDSCIMATVTVFEYERKLQLKEDYRETCFLEFEGRLFPAPSGWDGILRTMHGNYMEFPPVEERGNWHGTSVFEPDIPYDKYISAHYRGNA